MADEQRSLQHEGELLEQATCLALVRAGEVALQLGDCAVEPRIEMPKSRGPLPCLIEMPGLSRNTSATENAGRLSNWLRSIVEAVWPLGAW